MTSYFNEAELEQAHQYRRKNRRGLENDKICGCFYCLEIFNSNEIVEWWYDDTAECPYCGNDSVLGESSGFPITKRFLKEMHERWF